MRLGALLLACATLACARPLPPLRGTPAPDRSLPSLGLPGGHRHVTFKWEYEEGDIAARGDGAVRTAYPDSARLDFFLGGGVGAGTAILIGDTLSAPGRDLVQKYLPPVPLLWAALGRLAIPALRDTVVAMEGGVLRADVGRPPEWRVTARGDTLVALAHVSSGNITETLSRTGAGVVTYEVPRARRRLRLTVLRDAIGSFDASIWGL
ncbi:MAG TPA: hypothetical protein VFS56_11125 [Gemmatimonadaceae bacterium]|nr:hypothetical protein [Gemmatimonadaceae bacterium]